MNTWWRSGADLVMVWLAAALLCVLGGHAPAQGSGADREVLVPLSNNPLTGSPPSSSTNPDGTSSLFVPVILNASGQNDSFFTSELTLTNRSGEEATLHYTYTAHRGGGSGTATDRLAPGQQRIKPDAIGYLIDLGLPIPSSGHRLGTLRVEVSGSSEVGVSVRTTTSVPEGRAGLAYPGIAAAAGFNEAVYLCGLRQNTHDRSNLAFQHMGNPEEGPITLRTTVFSGEPGDPTPRVLEEVTLEPGGFHQYNGILATAGFTQGYVKVERVSGTAPFYAYGVINDNFNSDGSFVFPVTASSLMGARGQTLPVVVEMGTFTSELMVTNFYEEAKNLLLGFVADGIRTPDQTARFRMTIEAGQQRIIPDVIDTQLRQKGVAGVGATRGGLAGALFASVTGGDMSGIVIGARTSASDGRNGQYGVFYSAVPDGQRFTKSVWVDGLQQDTENRSNLALVNTGEVDDSPSVFHLEIYDGTTGRLANTVTGLTVAARGWRQINGILGKYAPSSTQGYVRIRKIFGNNPFLAYGVVNDGGAPGERSGDGAYLPAREAIHDPGAGEMTDREVLEVLYYATGGPGWTNRTRWLSDAPLSAWYGVTTDGSGRVTWLDLPKNGLSGGIPPELGRLTQLQWLRLWDNELSGGIPPELGGLTQLQRIRLGGNKLSGTIPPEMGGLTALQTLGLNSNQLSGAIPPEMGGLIHLKELNLRNNRLSGTIPPELGGLTQLQWLTLAGNRLSGGIPPELGGLTNLQVLVLGYNQLSGTIPSELGQLSRLQGLYLYNNRLNGAIPIKLQQLSELTLLNIQNTDICVPADASFQEWLNTIPRFFSSGLVCDGTKRVLFSASSYEVTEGEAVTVSVRLIDQTGDPVRSVVIALAVMPGGKATAGDYSGVPERVTIAAPENEASFVVTAVKDDLFDPGETVVLGFRRPLPSGITAGHPDTTTVTIEDPGTERVTDREVLEVFSRATGGTGWNHQTNWLSAAPLREWFGVETDGSGQVTGLDLSRNRLRGTIPPSLGQLSHLQTLSLPFNQLSGTIPPELGGLTALQTLDLRRNQLSGTIPPSLGQLSHLQTLDLALNNLSGTIPPELGGLTALQTLDLYGNQLRGTIPPSLGQLSHLQTLSLPFNRLSGTIPPELGGLTALQALSLALNQLRGTIPPSLGQLSHLQTLDLALNNLSGTIPPELGGLTALQTLDLYGNQLRGTIPPSLGQLSHLQTLSLSFNQLSGTIPPELGGMTALQTLNLSGNRLRGTIPPWLGQLSRLQTLDLSLNNLSGRIPPELGGMTALQTLDLSLNSLGGTIPPELGGMTALQRLSLGSNRLNSTIPAELGGMSALQTLNLGRNELSGGIPPELSGLINLQSLSLDGNRIGGTIPPELAGLTALRRLNLGFTPDLTGTIPLRLQRLPLQTLNLMATSVCVPEDAEFQEWLAMIERFTPSGLPCGPPADAMSSIDILVVYTPAARRIAGGTAEIKAIIDLMIAETNQAYLDSGVNQHVVLVAREKVEYTESGDTLRDFGRLISPSDGYMDEVHAIRDRAGADLVHFIVGSADVFGTAVNGEPFALTWAKAGSATFAHELGHNMGLDHDRYVDRGAFFPYSHGYVNQKAFVDGAPESARWTTIMAYPDQCSDEGFSCKGIMRFSNPNQSYLGDPLGVPGNERTLAVNGPADAVRALNLTRHSVAAFRPRASGNRLTMPATVSQARPAVRIAEALAPVPGAGLFQAVAPNEPRAALHQADSTLDRATLRRREVSVDIRSLARVPEGRGTALRLNLFDDVVLTGIIERRTPTFSGGFALSGYLAGVAGGSVTLVVNGSVVAGTVRIPGATCRIRPAGSGRHAIVQIDPSQLLQGCTVVKQTPNHE